MSALEKKVLEYIQEYTELEGYPPSLLEITEYFGASSTYAFRKVVDSLKTKGLLSARLYNPNPPSSNVNFMAGNITSLCKIEAL